LPALQAVHTAAPLAENDPLPHCVHTTPLEAMYMYVCVYTYIYIYMQTHIHPNMLKEVHMTCLCYSNTENVE
jgi:hypothetical protein